MSDHVTRRTFIETGAAALAGAALLATAREARAGLLEGRIKKAVKYNMIKGDMSVLDKFKMLKDLGFEGVEPGFRDKVDREEMRKASEATGLPIHGVVNGSVEDIDASVDLAKFYGANSVLIVAGRVDQNMSYAQNYADTQAKIREAIPYAKQNEIILLLENVWNNFLLSPLEMARYLDELDSEWVGAYFDVGNVARYGWPEHWIPVLGKRIKKLDIKPYSRKKQFDEGTWKGFNVPLGDGDIDWYWVCAELKKIDYRGWATAELPAGDREYLADVAARMDRVLGE